MWLVLLSPCLLHSWPDSSSLESSWSVVILFRDFLLCPRASLLAQMVKNRLQCRKSRFNPWVRKEDPLEKGMAIHSSILAWRIPWTEEPGRLHSIGLQRVRHNWPTLTFSAGSSPSPASGTLHCAQLLGYNWSKLKSCRSLVDLSFNPEKVL